MWHICHESSSRGSGILPLLATPYLHQWRSMAVVSGFVLCSVWWEWSCRMVWVVCPPSFAAGCHIPTIPLRALDADHISVRQFTLIWQVFVLIHMPNPWNDKCSPFVLTIWWRSWDVLLRNGQGTIATHARAVRPPTLYVYGYLHRRGKWVVNHKNNCAGYIYKHTH